MKYAVKLDENNNPILDKVGEFSEGTYGKLMSRKSGWGPYPGKKVFISFCEADRHLMKRLKYYINQSELLKALIIEEKRKGAIHLSELVQMGIRESSYFIPILTSNSISSQWVNQEIGFAKAFETIEKQTHIIPIVESKIIEDLKGFIHNQIQLSYNFRDDKTKRDFRKKCKEIVSIIEKEVLSFIRRKHK